MDFDKSPKQFCIGSHAIGSDYPAFIVAEVGINHNGSVNRAKELIDAAVAAGASAVKFQKRELSSAYTEHVLHHLDRFEQGLQYIIPILKEFELRAEQMYELKQYCDDCGILFLCTPFDPQSAVLLNDIGVSAFKTSSADLTNLLLLEKLAVYGKPLIVSCGMSETSEVDCTVGFLRKSSVSFALLHCVSSYPVDARDARLGRIPFLSERYGCNVGYSGHDMGIALSIAARTLGACIIEKHITLDRSLRGPDHRLSLLPSELKGLVDGIREVETALSDQKDYLLPAEVLNQLVFRKSVVAAVPINKGTVIERDMLTAKSPGKGLSVQKIDDVVGTCAKKDFEIDDTFSDFDLNGKNGMGSPPDSLFGQWGFVVRYHDFEQALAYQPKVLEFHLTYNDTQLDIPHFVFERHADFLSDVTLRVHCCEYISEELFDLCSLNSSVVQRSQELLQRVIDITSELSQHFNGDKPLIVFNCGAMTLTAENSLECVKPEALYSAIDNLKIGEVGLLAQSMPPNPWYFGGQWKGHYFVQPQELVDFCQKTGHWVCLDVSHAYMACVSLGIPFSEYIQMLQPYVKHIHLSDARSSEGEGFQVGTGDVDFGEFFRIFADYQGTWISEVWMGHVNDYYNARVALNRLASIHVNTRGE